MNSQETPKRNEISVLIEAVNAGQDGALSELIERAYHELKQIASSRLASERSKSISPTVLVHEMFIRVFGIGQTAEWKNRGHFFGAVANAMRQVLTDRARSKLAAKRGGKHVAVEFDLSQLPALKNASAESIVSLNDAVDLLASEDPVLAQLVELKFFLGHTTEEASLVLDVPLRTLNRRWKYAKARIRELIES